MRRILTILFALVCSVLFLHSVLALGPAEMGAFMVVSFVFLLLFWFVIIAIVFGGVFFWLWMFIDCLVRQDFRGQNDKIVWVLVLLFTSILGAVLYFFIVKRRLSKGKGKAGPAGGRRARSRKAVAKKR